MAQEELHYHLTFKAVIAGELSTESLDSSSNTASIESYLTLALLKRCSNAWVIYTSIEPFSDTQQHQLLFDAIVTAREKQIPLNSPRGIVMLEADLLMALEKRHLSARAIDTIAHQASYKYEDEHVKHPSPSK